MVRCSSCGASRHGKADHCEFCGSRFSTVDKGWGLICPYCFCRLPNDARYCVECGIALAPQKLSDVQAQRLCPRCTTPLRARAVATVEVLECASCNGLWVPADTFEVLCSQRDKASAARQLVAVEVRGRRRFELTLDDQVKYIPCPECRQLMNRRNFAQCAGVIIDICRDHGVWLDHQELSRIIQFIERGGIERARKIRDEQEAERLRQEQRRQARRAARVREGAFVGPAPPVPTLPLGGRGGLGAPSSGRVVGEAVGFALRLIFGR
jgi:Zn-finger nucleic acid-binding protein